MLILGYQYFGPIPWEFDFDISWFRSTFGGGLALVLVLYMFRSGYKLVLLETFQDKQYDTNQLGDYFENLIQKGYNDFENFIDEYLNGYQ